MRHLVKFGTLAVTFALGWAVCAAVSQDKKVKLLDSAKAEFKPVAPGASMAVVMGDPEKGKNSVFVKFDPGAKIETHHHTSDLRLVVLKGAYLYKGKNGEEHRVGPGMFISNPGGDHHWS